MSTDPNYRADVVWPEHERGGKPAVPAQNPDAPLLARLEAMLAEADTRYRVARLESRSEPSPDGWIGRMHNASEDADALRRVIGMLKAKEGGKV